MATDPLNIAFYITGHGLGHATRAVEVGDRSLPAFTTGPSASLMLLTPCMMIQQPHPLTPSDKVHTKPRQSPALHPFMHGPPPAPAGVPRPHRPGPQRHNCDNGAGRLLRPGAVLRAARHPQGPARLWRQAAGRLLRRHGRQEPLLLSHASANFRMLACQAPCFSPTSALLP